ncbi:ABC transporter permease [Bacillus sp. FJAT-49705]|uniref:ABC transporter permease n=1 Tax=Cytobacillus citreus TaxID=2833586 RepID=A0ABS5NZW2_9BACI|nr:ABC transporter permease [Cytobacillus citreus]MBS4193131.1 ABC transporter permease [Cytobacillus citreus]
MTLIQTLSIEFLKRSKISLFVSFIIPFLSLIIVFLAFQSGAMGDEIGETWSTFLMQLNMVLLFLIPLGITVISSRSINLEHQSNSWKLLLALPLRKEYVYMSKLIFVLLYSFLSSALLFFGIIGAGYFLGLGLEEGYPFILIMKQAFFPYASAIAIMSFQVFLSTFIKNQAFPIAIGVFTSIYTYSLMIFPTNISKWLFWTYPTLSSPLKPLFEDGNFTGVLETTDGNIYVYLSLVIGCFITFIGISLFLRKDIK